MKEQAKTWLEDIDRAIDEIYSFLPEKRDFFEFKKDLKTRKAVERNIEIIGEAMNRVLKENPEIEISNSRQIVDTRNRFIHGYDTVSEEIIWGIINKYLPILDRKSVV